MKRCLENQKVILSNVIVQDDERFLPMEPIRSSNLFTTVALISVGAAMGMAIIAGIRRCEVYPEPAKECAACHNQQMAMSNYFKKAGSKSPEEMAYAVLKTNNPRLLAAVSVVESNANPNTRRSGYKRRHDGAFQVNPKHWGRVPDDAIGQSLQAERILQELTQTMPIKKALSQYGGDSTDKYQRRVLAELVRVP